MHNIFLNNIVAIATEVITVETLLGQAIRASTKLSSVQYHILVVLESSPEGKSATELAAKLNAPCSTVTSSLAVLKRRGAIGEVGDALDGRVHPVKLRPLGKRLLKASDKAVADVLLPVWKTLSRRQYQLLSWSSIMASSVRGIARVEGGSVNVNFAYYEGSIISRRAIQEALAPAGLMPDDYRLLCLVVGSSGGLRAVDIGSELMLSSAAVSRISAQLAERRLLQVEESAQDRRSQLRRVTAEGEDLLQRCTSAVYEAMETGAIRLNADEMEQFVGIAYCVNDVLRQAFRYR